MHYPSSRAHLSSIVSFASFWSLFNYMHCSPAGLSLFSRISRPSCEPGEATSILLAPMPFEMPSCQCSTPERSELVEVNGMNIRFCSSNPVLPTCQQGDLALSRQMVNRLTSRFIFHCQCPLTKRLVSDNSESIWPSRQVNYYCKTVSKEREMCPAQENNVPVTCAVREHGTDANGGQLSLLRHTCNCDERHSVCGVELNEPPTLTEVIISATTDSSTPLPASKLIKKDFYACVRRPTSVPGANDSLLYHVFGRK